MITPIHVERGFSPWRPSSDAELVKQYHYFEIPLTGVVQQGDLRFLFHCAAGPDEPTSFWFYVPLTDALERQLDLADAGAFMSLVEVGDGCVLAMALNGPIVAFAPITDTTDLAQAGMALVDEVRSGLSHSEVVARTLAAA